MFALPDFLSQNQDGEIRVTNHRIGLFHLITHYNEGESAEMLASRYPTLPLSLVHRIIAFYLDNQHEVDLYMAKCTSAATEQRDSARSVDANVLRQGLLGARAADPETKVR